MRDLVNYENFLEASARLLSRLLTDKETETVVRGFTDFHSKLKKFSSENLRSLALQAAAKTKPQSICKHHGKTCSQNCIRGFIKAFVVGYTIKYVLGVAPALLTGRVLKSPSILRRELGKDTISFALFLSSFTSTYKCVLCLMRHFRKQSGLGDSQESTSAFALDVKKNRGSDRLNAFVAGACAGLCLSLERNRSRRTAIALYLLVRTMQFGSVWTMNQWRRRRLAKKEEMMVRSRRRGKRRLDDSEDDFDVGLSVRQEKPKPPTDVWDNVDALMRKWAGTAVIMASSSQILFAFLCMVSKM